MEKASSKNNFYYNKSLQQLAKANKKRMNRSAATMWNILRGGNLKGYKFRRERPILNYIADFCCLELLLVIEVDGLSHADHEIIQKDKIKDAALEEVGFTVLRFDSLYVMNHPHDVLKDLLFWIEDNNRYWSTS